MVRVKPSVCTCGKCGKEYSIEWDADIEYTEDREWGMGERVQYLSEEEQQCPYCGNRICARLEFWEYPVGTLEGTPEVEIQDFQQPYKSEISVPGIGFFDM